MIIKVRVITNSDSLEIMSRIGSVLRVRVPYSTYDGKTNEALKRLIANFFEVNPKKVFVRRGHSGKEKTIEIEGKSEHELRQVLESIP